STEPDLAIWRALDAAANRASEGLRVVEDWVRFVLDDSAATSRLKTLRHELDAAVSRFPRTHLLAARDTVGDVGTTLTASLEGKRADPAELLTANFKRTEQALRTLEEMSKLAAPGLAPVFESLRYRTYTEEKLLLGRFLAVHSWPEVAIYVLVDGGSDEATFRERVTPLVTAGVEAIQLRDKTLDDRTLLARARLLRQLTAETTTRMIVNDRPDLAKLSLADGVHVGQEELTVRDVRAIVGPRMLIGVSTHNIAQARQAVADGADYLGIGPTFPSTTKRFESFPGLEFVAQVAQEIKLPAFAIGGITGDNAAQVAAAGITRVAVSGAVSSAESPGDAIERLRAAITSP
ncbi:MAG: thiamine phosphate synthase, partial [Pirellulaceae bacterium]